MKIRVQQLNPVIGNIEANTSAIQTAIDKAESAGIDLLLLPELAVSGYSPLDFLEHSAFRQKVYRANDRIAQHTQNTAVLFGNITPNDTDTGKPCFNSAIFAHQGKIKATIHKMLLPTYSVYDELRYFEPGKKAECIEYKNRTIGITICEDIWCNYGDNQLVKYAANPVQQLADQGAEAILNLSASPFDTNKQKSRVEMINANIERTGIPVFYANQVGGNTDLVSDGDSMVINKDQDIIARAPLFEEAQLDIKWNGDKISAIAGGISTPSPKNEAIFKALQYGLQEYLRKSGMGKKAVLGLSGGIDSALVAVIAKEALGADALTCVTMPSPFSSSQSVVDAQALCDNLGIELKTLEIEPLYKQALTTLDPLFGESSFGLAEENIQARIRGMLLMALSNKHGGLVLNTGNKSEAAVGYATLYGDLVGGLSVIGDLFKTEVFALARWLNEEYYQETVIPASILTKPPSAELRPDQKDTDSLPEYKILDPILELYIEQRLSTNEIIDRGFDKEVVQKTIHLVQRNEYKRNQAPPALKVHYTSFGSGLRWPIVGKVE